MSTTVGESSEIIELVELAICVEKFVGNVIMLGVAKSFATRQ